MRRQALPLLAIISAAASLFACAITDRAEGDGAADLAREIDRLEARVAEIETAGVPEPLRGGLTRAREGLVRARNTESPLLRLYRLRDPFLTIETLAWVTAHANAASSVEAFERHWSSRRVAHDPLLPREGSFVHLALAQAAENRAEKLFHASLPYAKVSDPFSGLYYLGEAEANRRFAAFVRTVARSSSVEPTPPAAVLRAVQESLEGDAIALFENDPTSRDAIPVSARLKESREQLEAGHLHGATLTILESRLGLSRRGIAPRTASTAAQTPAGSLGALLSAMTEEEEPATAALVRSDVLPLYGQLMERRR